MDGHGVRVQLVSGTLLCGAAVTQDRVHPNCRIDDVRLVVLLSFRELIDLDYHITRERCYTHSLAWPD